jgi:hypothetical protein
MQQTMDVCPPALLRRHPELVDRIPWTPLGRFPTPLDVVEIGPEKRPVLVKREDVSGAEYAGNKVRKLEFLLAAAGARGARRLITAGSVGSHHALATTVYGKAMGFDVSLVLFPQSLNDHVRRILLADAALGAELRWVSRMEMVPLGMFRARLAFMAGKPFVVAPGGSDAVGGRSAGTRVATIPCATTSRTSLSAVEKTSWPSASTPRIPRAGSTRAPASIVTCGSSRQTLWRSRPTACSFTAASRKMSRSALRPSISRPHSQTR